MITLELTQHTVRNKPLDKGFAKQLSSIVKMFREIFQKLSIKFKLVVWCWTYSDSNGEDGIDSAEAERLPLSPGVHLYRGNSRNLETTAIERTIRIRNGLLPAFVTL